MTDELLQHFLDKFDENDTDKKGSIQINQFKALFSDIMSGNASDESAEMYFRGIDANNKGKITRQEFSNFVSAALNKDQDYMIKLAFRSFDKDQSQNLNCAEVKAIAKYVSRDMTDDEVEAAMQSFTGSKNGSLTYPQVYKMITGKDLDGSTTNVKPSSSASKPTSSSKPTSQAEQTAQSTIQVQSTRSAGPAQPASTTSNVPDAPEDVKKKSSCCLLI